jgi:hypothetical protein
MEALGDVLLGVAYERLAGMVACSVRTCKPWLCTTPRPLTCAPPDTLTPRRERIAGIHRLSIDTIELYQRNTIDELAPRLAHGSYR